MDRMIWKLRCIDETPMYSKFELHVSEDGGTSYAVIYELALGRDDVLLQPLPANKWLPLEEAPANVQNLILQHRVKKLSAELATLRSRCERQDGDPTAEEMRRWATSDTVAPSFRAIARVVLRAWGEEA